MMERWKEDRKLSRERHRVQGMSASMEGARPGKERVGNETEILGELVFKNTALKQVVR